MHLKEYFEGIADNTAFKVKSVTLNSFKCQNESKSSIE